MSVDLPPGLSTSTHSSSNVSPTSGANYANHTSTRPIQIPYTDPNFAMAVTELNLAVAPVSQRHYDLVAISKNKVLSMATGSLLQVYESSVVQTLTQLAGQIVDVSFSPFHASFVAAVSDAGEAVVHEVGKSLSTFKIIPNPREGPKPFLKVMWHPTNTTSLLTAYRDGLICAWDLSVATQNPPSIVDTVTTIERPTQRMGIVYTNFPSLLVTMHANEDIVDFAVVRDYVIAIHERTGISVFDMSFGGKLLYRSQAKVSNVVVVSEVPFVFATSSGPNNRIVTLWTMKSASPLVFDQTEFCEFAPLPLPAGHPGHRTSFQLLRTSLHNMLIMTHPYLGALWVIKAGASSSTHPRVLTYGSKVPIEAIATHNPSQGFVATSNTALYSLQFSTSVGEKVPLVPASVLAMSCSPTESTESDGLFPQYQIHQHTTDLATNMTPGTPTELIATTPTASSVASHTSNTEEATTFSLDDVRTMLLQQNEAILHGIRENRELTLKKQSHVLKCLTELPTAIMDSLTPVLENLATTKSKSVDGANIAASVAESAKAPSSLAIGGYFREALIPGFQKACASMTHDIHEVLDSASVTYQAQLTPIHTAKVIEPLVNGLALASNKLTHVYKEAHQPAKTTQPSSATSTAKHVTASGAASTQLAIAGGPTTQPATVASSSSSAAHQQNAPAAPAHTATGSISLATATPATTTPSKKKKGAANVAQPSPPSSNASSLTTSTAPNPSVSTPTQISTSAAVTESATVTPPKSETPPPPRPDPKNTIPVSEECRASILSLVGKKQLLEAVDAAIASGTVEAIGFLTSRSDITQWINSLSQTQMITMLDMILKQTPWPSRAQVQKYSGAVSALLTNLDVTQFKSHPQAKELVDMALQWTTGTNIESTTHPMLSDLAAHIAMQIEPAAT